MVGGDSLNHQASLHHQTKSACNANTLTHRVALIDSEIQPTSPSPYPTSCCRPALLLLVHLQAVLGTVMLLRCIDSHFADMEHYPKSSWSLPAIHPWKTWAIFIRRYISTAFGANFFTASPTVRDILSSPMSSVNFAAWSFWITVGPGSARISCKWQAKGFSFSEDLCSSRVIATDPRNPRASFNVSPEFCASQVLWTTPPRRGFHLCQCQPQLLKE